MLIAASVTKLANLVHRKVLADPGVPFVAGLHLAVMSLACFFQMLFAKGQRGSGGLPYIAIYGILIAHRVRMCVVVTQ